MKIPVFTYHDIGGAPSPISISPENFERGLEILYEKGFRTVGLSDLTDNNRKRNSLDERPMVITFDDGYRGVYLHAFPVLRGLGMTGTVFLTTGNKAPEKKKERLQPVSGRQMLDGDEISHMKRAGFDFGAHTLTHPDLTRIPRQEATEEILRSKALVEYFTQDSVHSFAYPFGVYDQEVYKIVEKNFSRACSTKLAMVDEDSDRFALPRIEMHYFRSERALRTVGTSWFSIYLLARRIPRLLRLWFLKRVGA